MKPFKMFSLKQQRYFTATDFIMVALEGKANSNNIKVKSSPKKNITLRFNNNQRELGL